VSSINWAVSSTIGITETESRAALLDKFRKRGNLGGGLFSESTIKAEIALASFDELEADGLVLSCGVPKLLDADKVVDSRWKVECELRTEGRGKAIGEMSTMSISSGGSSSDSEDAMARFFSLMISSMHIESVDLPLVEVVMAV
jgi:hypothetical protein